MNCPECGSKAEQVDVDWTRHNGRPNGASEVLACQDGHEVTVHYRVRCVREGT